MFRFLNRNLTFNRSLPSGTVIVCRPQFLNHNLTLNRNHPSAPEISYQESLKKNGPTNSVSLFGRWTVHRCRRSVAAGFGRCHRTTQYSFHLFGRSRLSEGVTSFNE